MYSVKFVSGHVNVYNFCGDFLFSADSMQEAREEIEEYEKSAT